MNTKQTLPSKQQEKEWVEAYRLTNDKQAIENLYYQIAWPVIQYNIYSYHIKPAFKHDVEQECFFAVCQACNKWDPTKARFMTYSKLWIKACIFTWLQKNSGIIKIYTNDNRDKIFFGLAKAIEALEQAQQLVNTLTIASKLKVPEKDVIDVMSYNVVNMDSKVNHDNTSTYHDTLSSNALTPEDMLFQSEQDYIVTGAIEYVKSECNALDNDVLDNYFNGSSYMRVAKRHAVTIAQCKQRETILIDRIAKIVQSTMDCT